MEEAGGVDLTQFRLWYSQAGTPRVVAGLVDQPGGRVMLTLAQHVPATPGQPTKQAMVLPLKLRLFGADTGRALTDEWLVLLASPTKEVAFEGLAERPALPINRGFSAPRLVKPNRNPAPPTLTFAH